MQATPNMRISQSHVASIPHHRALDRVASSDGIAAAARMLLGIKSTILLKALDPYVTAYSVHQAYEFKIIDSSGTALRPVGVLPRTLKVDVTHELPSSCTVRFKLHGHHELILQAHVQPRSYDGSAVSLVLQRTFSAWPGADMVARCATNAVSFSYKQTAAFHCSCCNHLPLVA